MDYEQRISELEAKLAEHEQLFNELFQNAVTAAGTIKDLLESKNQMMENINDLNETVVLLSKRVM